MEALFWIALTIIFYVYFGYPLALVTMSWRARPTKQDERFFPSVSLIIAAHNEEKIIKEKIENCLALDYPRARLEIVIASDGSSDATNEIARRYADRGIILHEIFPRGGKTRALNLTIPKTTGEILVLSDANTMYRPDALQKLARHFADPGVGAVSGDVRLVDAAESHAYSEGLYYRYERWLQSMESRIGSIIGADGGMYAVSRSFFRAPSNVIILDDFVISMTVARLGWRVLYEPEAIAIERGTLSSREEFQRKVRIIAGGIQALRLREGLPCLHQSFLLFCYVSHKLLRWLMPCLLLALFCSSAVLTHNALFQSVFFAQSVFYMSAMGYAIGFPRLRCLQVGNIPYYFCLVNSAALVGLWKGLRGTQGVTWQKTAR